MLCYSDPIINIGLIKHNGMIVPELLKLKLVLSLACLATLVQLLFVTSSALSMADGAEENDLSLLLS